MSLTTNMDHQLPEESLQGGGRWCVGGAVRVAAVWLLMTLAGGGSAWAQGAAAAKVSAKEQVVAKVNGMPIYASDLDAMVKAQVRMLKAQLANEPAQLRKELEDVKRRALNELIDFQLLEDEFFRLGGVIQKEDLDNDLAQAANGSFNGNREALMAEINAIGIPFEKYREMRERLIIVSAVRARIVNNVEVTEPMMREHYEKNLQRWRAPESVKFHTLTILKTSANARMLADSLRTRMVNGGDFAEMARENSADSRAGDGGAWPWTSLADINDQVGMVLAKMKKGELSEVLEEPDTFLLLRVDDIRESDPLPYESVKEVVKKSLMDELAKERIENRLCRLRESAAIQKMGSA